MSTKDSFRQLIVGFDDGYAYEIPEEDAGTIKINGVPNPSDADVDRWTESVLTALETERAIAVGSIALLG